MFLVMRTRGFISHEQSGHFAHRIHNCLGKQIQSSVQRSYRFNLHSKPAKPEEIRSLLSFRFLRAEDTKICLLIIFAAIQVLFRFGTRLNDP